MTKNLWLLLLGIALLGVALALPSAKQVVQEGDSIAVDYVLTLEDGTVYYSSIGGEPLKATIGQGELISGFEEQLMGMQVGETRTFTLPPEKAYGNYRPEMVGTFDRSRLPEGVEPEIGKQIQANLKDGTQAIAVITSFTDTTVTLDANHPLVGRTLTFDVKLMAIEANETSTGVDPMTLGWVILAVGVTVAGFVFFKTRDPRLATAAKRA